jgi:hypothetical protein
VGNLRDSVSRRHHRNAGHRIAAAFDPLANTVVGYASTSDGLGGEYEPPRM